jgi:tetratricopeptide (TPR) repeat protein
MSEEVSGGCSCVTHGCWFIITASYVLFLALFYLEFKVQFFKDDKTFVLLLIFGKYMEHSILLVDLVGEARFKNLTSILASADLDANIVCCESSSDISSGIDSIEVAGLIISINEYSEELDLILRDFQTRVGALPEFIMIICDEPSPRFLVSLFEFGIEAIKSYKRAEEETVGWVKGLSEALENEESPSNSALKLSRGIKQKNSQMIIEAGKEVAAMVEYDYKAAYISGKAQEMQGDFAGAEESYRAASSMNRMFRPSNSSLGETLLINGKTEEAIAIFEKLEKSNPRDMGRKMNLVTAYVESGDIEKANDIMQNAESLQADHPKLIEAKAHLLLSQGKIGEAFGIMDGLQDAGPMFAARLNDLGIKLSKSGKVKNALALYNKAHRIVREDIKYKISLNAGLACRRAGAYGKALQYLKRCEIEHGGVFPKLQKIMVATQAAHKKKQLASSKVS